MKKLLLVLMVGILLLPFLKTYSVKGEGILVKVETDKTVYKLGEIVNITFTISNESNTPQKLIFNTAQIYDFVIFNIAKNDLGFYRWSQGKMFAQVITEINLEPNEVKTFKEQWNQKSNSGSPVSVGTYRLNFWLVNTTSIGKIYEPGSIGKFGQSQYFATTIFIVGQESQNVSPFIDVTDPELIKYLSILNSRGIIKGYPDGTFRPQNHLTRAETVALILRVMNITPQRYLKSTFSDVARTHWAFNIIEEAYRRGIVKGVSLAIFSPNAYITRGEFTVMMMRALEFELSETQNPFVDIDRTYFGYKEVINAYNLDIVQGTNVNGKLYFYPYSPITRGEAVLILGRVIEKKEETVTMFSIKGDFKEKAFATSEKPVSFSPNVLEYAIKSSEVKNLWQFQFSEKELKALENYGFFVKEASYKTFSEFFDESRGPIFISFDTFLHSYHVIFDMVLRFDEIEYFVKDLDELVTTLLRNSISQYSSASSALKDAVKRNIAFFYIGEKLLNPQYKLLISDAALKMEIENIAQKEINLIEAHQGITKSPLFLYEEDYSQYVPRGHYTRNETFKRYFKAMMWFGRMRFLLKPPENINLGRTQTQSAILETVMLANDTHLISLYDRIYEPTVFFVGRSDDINFFNYILLIKEVYGETVNLNDLMDTAKLDSFIDRAIKEIPDPGISTTGEVIVLKEKGFRFMGQRFTPDAYILQNLVFPKADYRMLPKAMDTLCVFGSQEAENILFNVFNEKENISYVNQVNKLKQEFSESAEKDWLQNLYWGWLSLIKTYAYGERKEGYPTFMRSNNWARKELMTSLASYTELKHDTILYAKQSYTLKTAIPSDIGYVEPNVEGYNRLLTILDMTQKGLSERGLLPLEINEKIELLKRLTKGALEISVKELENKPLTSEDEIYFGTFKTSIDSLFSFSEEMTAKLMGNADKRIALVADIHTDPNGGVVLEEGVGDLFTIYVIAPYKGVLNVFEGPVLSYYEFTQKMANRLTDETWQNTIDKGNTPAIPVWVKSIMP